MMKKVIKKRKHLPTIKQIKTLQLMAQGMNKTAAMRQAGYTPTSANKPNKDFFKSPAVQGLLLGMREEMIQAGLTSQYMLGKFKQWLEATKVDHSHTEPDSNVPDYDIQIKAYDRWATIMEKGQEASRGTVKRQISFTEFVTGESDKGGER